ncbi:MAG TPA: hypothetical protein PK693_00960 [Halothiobacillus sp.]|jgi:hypothetical protein|nr:hypothetical protein [Halothiobacillus sp.]HQS28307.1 hypothetical protein [Halothiobacillus sp.]
MKLMSVFPLLATGLLLAGCTTTDLQGVNNSLAQLNGALSGQAPNANLSGGGLFQAPVTLSPADQQRIQSLIQQSANNQNDQLKQNIQASESVITNSINIMASTSGKKCGLLERYGVPGSFYCADADPFTAMANTPRSTPLQVQSVGNWQLQTRNAFTMSVTFCSSISGACASKSLKVINLGSGWQLSQVGSYVN